MLIGGEIVNDVPPTDRDIAMVFQSYALYPHMTVYANMAFGLKLHRVKKAEIRPRVHVGREDARASTSCSQRKPSQLSGGQRQRVAMGRAIVREPDAFLMDEPLSNLDAKLRVEMRAYLATLHQQLRTTTLYVTHDQTEAMTMGDRVAVMRDGRLQQVDRPQVLYERPVNLFVAGFIGSPAMNLLRARLDRAGTRCRIELGDTTLSVPSSVLRARPRLADYVGRDVIVGIRPEDIEDAALVPVDERREPRRSRDAGGGARRRGDRALPAGRALGRRRAALVAARGSDSPLLETAAEGDVVLTARLSPRTGRARASRWGLRRRRAAHFFDPETEEAIW